LLGLDDAFDNMATATAPCSSPAGSRNGSRRAGACTDDVTDDAVVNGVAVADDHLRIAFIGQCSQLKVTFNIEFNRPIGRRNRLLPNQLESIE
jgi:hypothetical protein